MTKNAIFTKVIRFHSHQGITKVMGLLLNKPVYAVCLLIILSMPIAQAESIIRLATTTSTDNSGLLKVLLPPFEKITGYQVHVIAVGTGKALKMGEQGDADVLLVHARAKENAFLAAGHGINRRDVMYNDFLIVGPPTDPAKVKGMQNAPAALQQIQQASETFISRGDHSGTHSKELTLWAAAGLAKPSGRWYREIGQGMGATLQMAGELNAYTLVDRGTWLAYKANSPLSELVTQDATLFNPYGIMAVNPNKYRDINYLGAMTLIAWMTSVAGQEIINNFKIAGEQLFIPTAIEF